MPLRDSSQDLRCDLMAAAERSPSRVATATRSNKAASPNAGWVRRSPATAQSRSFVPWDDAPQLWLSSCSELWAESPASAATTSAAPCEWEPSTRQASTKWSTAYRGSRSRSSRARGLLAEQRPRHFFTGSLPYVVAQLRYVTFRVRRIATSAETAEGITTTSCRRLMPWCRSDARAAAESPHRRRH